MKMLPQLLRSLVDRRTGLVTSIDYVLPIAGGPLIHTYRGALTHIYAFCDDKLIREDIPQVIVSGIGLEANAALWSLLGEAVERYSAYSFDSSHTITAPFIEIASDAIDPTEWIGFDYENTPTDFAYKRFDATQDIRWAWATNLSGGPSKLVPATHVWLRLGEPLPGENFAQRASTGLGAGTSVQRAILSGLLEVVERDAFSTRWLLSAPPPKKTGLDGNIQLLREQLQRSGIRLELFDLAVDGFAPVSLAKLTLPERQFGLCLGASCARSPEEADMKAALEAYHILQGMLFWQNKLPAPMLPSAARDFVDHGRYYSQPSPADSIQWFFNDGSVRSHSVVPPLPEGSYEAAIGEIIERLNGQGFKVYYVDITPADIQEAGFSVVKMLIPGMQPLTCGERVVADDPRRLNQVAISLLRSDADSINRTLQPFA